MDANSSHPAKVARSKLWFYGPVFVVIVLLILLVPLPQAASTPTDRTIRIEASRFQFVPGEIHVNPGDKVTVELISQDVVHGLSLDNYNFNLQAEPGQIVTGTFIANQSGVFRFRCSFTCGNLHPFMIGKLTVGSNYLLIRGIALAGLAVAGAFLSMWFSTTRHSQGVR
jgi:heme/copper-type cytochrome/quinol oxidase subunit 2